MTDTLCEMTSLDKVFRRLNKYSNGRSDPLKVIIFWQGRRNWFGEKDPLEFANDQDCETEVTLQKKINERKCLISKKGRHGEHNDERDEDVMRWW